MVNQIVRQDVVIPLEKVLDYGEVTLFDNLPPQIRESLQQNSEFIDVPRRIWRKIPLAPDAVWETNSRVVVPVRMIIKLDEGKSKQRDTPLNVGCQTEYVALTRIYEWHFPTRYLAGQSEATGTIYWTES